MRRLTPLLLAALTLAACSSNGGGADPSADGGSGDGTVVGDAPRDGGTCPVANEPCFKSLKAAFDQAIECMGGYRNTCKASGNTDASGCGTYANSDRLRCNFPNGAYWNIDLPRVTYNGPKGQLCMTATGIFGPYQLPPPDYRVWSYSIAEGVTTIHCPDGTASSWNPAEDTNRDCVLTTPGSCCSSVSPATCTDH